MIGTLLARARLSLFALVTLVSASAFAAAIPATPVMTLYRFNGDLNLPYFDIEGFSG